MTLIQAIALGIIQGLGEFLPISSSGHLVITPWLFNWTDPGLSFDVALHFGTLLAVLIYFAKDWIIILKSAVTRQPSDRYNATLFWILVAATIPGALAGYILEEQAETVFRHPLLVAATLSVVGFLLYWADKICQGVRDLKDITWKEGVLIGLAQAIAIVPGVSRSGSTITAALLLGYDRINAARFSFLLSTPIIFGATILQLDDFISNGIGQYEVIGIIAAAVSGYLAIAGLLRLVQVISYKVFFWYRLVLALLIVVLYFIR